MSGVGGFRKSGVSYENMRIIGKVVDNMDPLQMRRLKVAVPELYGQAGKEELPWCMPKEVSIIGNTSNCGSFGVPIIDSLVYLVLKNDDPQYPEWDGGPVNPETTKGEIETTNYPTRYGMRDEVGNYFYVDRTTKDVEFFHSSGTKIHIAPNGAVTIEIVADETIHVAGNLSATVDGSATVHVEGDVTATVGGNVSATISGNLDTQVSGTATVQASGKATLQGSNVDVIGATIACQGNVTVSGTLTGAGTATFSGNVIGAGVSLNTHKHGGVDTGGGQTSPPV